MVFTPLQKANYIRHKILSSCLTTVLLANKFTRDTHTHTHGTRFMCHTSVFSQNKSWLTAVVRRLGIPNTVFTAGSLHQPMRCPQQLDLLRNGRCAAGHTRSTLPTLTCSKKFSRLRRQWQMPHSVLVSANTWSPDPLAPTLMKVCRCFTGQPELTTPTPLA